MDVEAILTRRPQVVLVDELAHTNIPGSKHRKRYEDVQELGAKIDVLSRSISTHRKHRADRSLHYWHHVRETVRLVPSLPAKRNVDLTPEALQNA